MIKPLNIIVIYDHPEDPIVHLLKSYQDCLGHTITLVSLELFIQKMQISDKINKDGVSIQWKLNNDHSSTGLSWNNQDSYLVNRCGLAPPTWTNAFHPDDEEYVWNELMAYLCFSFTAFKYRLQPVGYYGPSGAVMPLFTQWDIIKSTCASCKVPDYYIGPSSELPWEKAVCNPDCYDGTNWVEGPMDMHQSLDYLFTYRKPMGHPILVYFTPIDAALVSFDEEIYVRESQVDLLKSWAKRIGEQLGIRLGEVLFFIDKETITFGYATPKIIHGQCATDFKRLTLEALTTPTAYQHSTDIQKYPVLPKHAETKTFIAIGSEKDHTMRQLITSDTFGKKGRFLPLEELNKNWNFIYSNGSLRFIQNNQWITEPQAIYYRSFAEKEHANNSFELLYHCLNSTHITVYGRGVLQYLNSSKPLQLAHWFTKHGDCPYLLFPETRIVKHVDDVKDILEQRNNPYITKSISGIRSIVVNDQTFNKWDKNGLRVLPTLFQKEIKGDDIRVHVCHDQVLAIKIRNKDQVDYRYTAGYSKESMDLPKEIIAYCRNISRLEDNPLIGIDLIQTKEGYVFLEANPMPGWNWFYNDDTTIESICHKIIDGVSWNIIDPNR